MEADDGTRGAPTMLQYSGTSLEPLVQAALRVMGDGTRVFAPEAGREVRAFAPCEPGKVPAAGYWATLTNTDISPKGYLLPQTEDVMRWRGGTGNLAIEEPEAGPPAVLLGIRPCDAAAFELLDEVLIGGPFVDQTYRRRRERTVLITMACTKPGPACACDAFGLSPGHRSGDVVVYPSGGRLLVLANSPKGEEILGALQAEGGPGGAVPADPGWAGEVVAAACSTPTPLGERILVQGLLDNPQGIAGALFASKAWDRLAPRCLSCGACTYVCPTCYCFAVNDEPRGQSGRRVRTWDSCQFKDFLTMAGGHNPRPGKLERVRQRFLHKLNYHPQRYGKFLCVGCGRCVLACPVGLHIGEVAEALAAEIAPLPAPVPPAAGAAAGAAGAAGEGSDA